MDAGTVEASAMVRTNKRLWVCCLLLTVNLAFIWGNSLLPGAVSATVSKALKAFLTWVFGGGGGQSQGGDGFLRKLAHFGEFACLGMLLRWLFGMLLRDRWQYYIWPLTAGIAVACVDETIQLFVPGRGPHIKDVGIDTLGLALGICIISLITHIMKKKIKENTL